MKLKFLFSNFKISIIFLALQIITTYSKIKEKFIYERNRNCETYRGICYNNTKVEQSRINTGAQDDFVRKFYEILRSFRPNKAESEAEETSDETEDYIFNNCHRKVV